MTNHQIKLPTIETETRETKDALNFEKSLIRVTCLGLALFMSLKWKRCDSDEYNDLHWAANYSLQISNYLATEADNMIQL